MSYDKNYERIFGTREPAEFQKDSPMKTTPKSTVIAVGIGRCSDASLQSIHTNKAVPISGSRMFGFDYLDAHSLKIIDYIHLLRPELHTTSKEKVMEEQKSGHEVSEQVRRENPLKTNAHAVFGDPVKAGDEDTDQTESVEEAQKDD